MVEVDSKFGRRTSPGTEHRSESGLVEQKREVEETKLAQSEAGFVVCGADQGWGRDGSPGWNSVLSAGGSG